MTGALLEKRCTDPSMGTAGAEAPERGPGVRFLNTAAVHLSPAFQKRGAGRGRWHRGERSYHHHRGQKTQ